MNSPGHRDSILSLTYCDIGVGKAYNASSEYGTYWTQDFGRRFGVSTCPATPIPEPEPKPVSIFPTWLDLLLGN